MFFLGVSVVGIPYLLCKVILVRRGEIAIAESISGNPRVLGVGYHVLETLNATVRRAKVTDDIIKRKRAASHARYAFSLTS